MKKNQCNHAKGKLETLLLSHFFFVHGKDSAVVLQSHETHNIGSSLRSVIADRVVGDQQRGY